MVAVAYTDITPTYTDVTPLRAVREVPRTPARRPAPASDPVVDLATRALTMPLRQVYAVLWRTGLLSVDA